MSGPEDFLVHRMFRVDDRDVWDSLLSVSGAPTLIQRWTWGEYKKSRGLTVKRILGECGGGWWAAQGWTLGPSPVLWAPEGPVTLPSDAAKAARKTAVVRPTVVIGSPFPEATRGRHVGAFRLPGMLFHPEEAIVDLSPPESELMGRLHQKWRNQLRQGLKREVDIREVNAEEGLRLHTSMIRGVERKKGFASPWSGKALLALFASGMPTLCLAGVSHDEALAIKIIAIDPPLAMTIASAVSENGKALGAGYTLHWKAYAALKARNVVAYNLGGSDSVANNGVAMFKARAAAVAFPMPGSFAFSNSRAAVAIVSRATEYLFDGTPE